MCQLSLRYSELIIDYEFWRANLQDQLITHDSSFIENPITHTRLELNLWHHHGIAPMTEFHETMDLALLFHVAWQHQAISTFNSFSTPGNRVISGWVQAIRVNRLQPWQDTDVLSRPQGSHTVINYEELPEQFLENYRYFVEPLDAIHDTSPIFGNSPTGVDEEFPEHSDSDSEASIHSH